MIQFDCEIKNSFNEDHPDVKISFISPSNICLDMTYPQNNTRISLWNFLKIFHESVDRNSDSISYFKIDPAARKVKVSIDAGVRHDILLTKISTKS